jgi:hypothetical protein
MRTGPLVCLLVCLLAILLPGSLEAQTGPAQGDRVSSSASVLLKAGDVAGRQRLLLGGGVGLVFGHRLAVGGGGVALTENVEIPGSTAGSGFQLGMGYGGLVLQYWHPLPFHFKARTDLLVGGGHAEISDRLLGRELGADNFFVAEPELGLTRRLFSILHAGVSVGYRWVRGLDDLPRLSNEDFQAVTWTLRLRVGGP